MTVDATLVALICGFLIPPLNALVTKANAPLVLKSVVALALAALTAIGAYIADVHGAVTVKQLAMIAALALISAGGSRVTAFSHVEEAVKAKTANVGIG